MTKSRIDRLRNLISTDESVFITDLTNIRYLCGFTGSSATMIVDSTQAWLFTDSRYDIQARSECFNVEIIIDSNPFIRACKSVATEAIIIESRHMSVSDLETLHFHGTENTKNSTELIEQLRVVKDVEELEIIKHACEISVAALRALLPTLHEGQSEREIAVRLDRLMVDLGADEPGFATIVAAGTNSAIPHHQPTNKPLLKGDLLKIDFGAKINGYHSDFTRTFCFGTPSDWQLDIHQAVYLSQQSSLDALRAGAQLKDVDAVARDIIKAKGYGEHFTHGLGHGVGLHIHEDPFFRSHSDSKILQGTVVTIEPGIYLPDLGGVRIEDTVVVTEFGHQKLTQFDYDLIDVSG